MRNLLQRLLRPFLTWLAAKISSAPDSRKVHSSLTRLLNSMIRTPGKRGTVLEVDFSTDSIIVFSDHHKGDKSSSDDFENNEPNYLAALAYYNTNQFTYINLGDSEELWKFKPKDVISRNAKALQAEALFHERSAYYKTFGNHDLIWKNPLDVILWFKDIFSMPLPVLEGILLKTIVERKPLTIYLTHGHQGDKMSDNNVVTTWIVAHLWQPVQRYLRININTPAKDYKLRGKHNIMMYDWSARKDGLVLITGHTHMPVFASGRYSDHTNNNVISGPEKRPRYLIKPSYFNSGCCCYNDGDITGIEISENQIRLVRWHVNNGISERIILEQNDLSTLVSDLTAKSSG